ncbi:hypothetical protein QR680_017651 [Steinernema hermaphroditum]|uniref:Uncharacterized protein n=1 Tax=Steinernema hermaphroditum TaxID=289476 RepID=A0AA39LPI0_9BILA|nr:hypothetical protein QR680_017651 [Steinernema hermaphroditum]
MRYATPVWNRRDTKYSVDSSSTDWGSDSFDRFPSNPYNVCPPPYEPEADYDDDESAQSTPKTLKGILKRRENNNPSENVQRYIQYGPGIVRRLKERFSKISGAVSQDAEISPHSRRKRYPSVDDILSTDEISTEQARRNHLETSRINGYHQSQDHLDSKPSSALPLQAPTSSPVARNEKSSCAPHGFTEAQASYIIHNPNRIHRLVPVSVQMVQQKETLEKPVDDNTLEPISLLRAKFEHSSRRTDPKIDVRPFRSLSSAPYEKENEPLEPEFLRVHRQLKKTPVRPLKNDRTSSSDHSDLYGANEFYEISPPPADPLPTRAESQNLPVLLTTNDRSPPPEEPKHHDVGDDESLLLSDSDTASYDISAAPAPLIKIPDFGNVDASDVKDTQNKGHDLVTSKINFSNDDSGVGEMHRLLNRFRKTTPAPPPPTKLPSSNIVSIAVGGEESRRDTPRFSWSSAALKSIYSDEPSNSCQNSTHSASKRPAPVSQQPSSDCASPPRKSLSDRFLETKQQLDHTSSAISSHKSESSRKPYGDDAVELSTDDEERHAWNHADTESDEEKDGRVVLLGKKDLQHDQPDDMKALRESFLKTHYPGSDAITDSSEDEDDEEVERRNIASIIRPANLSVAYIMHHAGAKTALFLSMLAGDGNPVRHSLVNLVLEEDLPMLMEAMSEECNVCFEDYNDSTTASTSSIIHAPSERRERRRQRNVDRISFVNEPPRVFSYLDEKSCEEEGLWLEGNPITYQDYQKMVDEATETQLQAQMELQRWQQSLQTQEPVEPQNPSSDEFALGVTSKLSYGGLQSFSPIAIASNDTNTSSI